ncbi:MAG: hypothetical protein H6741_25930 [Alphaproteobacteria bacterium]|nr:hypothetical protein [Alphaproteobacteria bacterium]
MTPGRGLLAQRQRRGAERWPHADLSVPMKRKLLEALSLAWSRLGERAKESGEQLNQIDEDTLTFHLKDELNHLLDEGGLEGFSGRFFQHVMDDAKQDTLDQASIDKMPDLVFRLVNHDGQWPADRAWYVEAKPVVKGEGLKSSYGREGICRFVEGDYAWTMPSGLMLGYAGAERSVTETLHRWLKRESGKPKGGVCRCEGGGERDAAVSPPGHPVWRSRHSRDHLDPYEGHSHGPGELVLHHLWLPTE